LNTKSLPPGAVTAPPRAGHFFKRFYCFFVAVFAAIPVSSISPAANAEQAGNADYIESVFVIGQRRAYQGNFDDLENPSAVQSIDGELLREVGALNLNDALDLSASVARQNNFGGLWNSFSIRGFAGDINLPSGFLVNGFNAGRGFGGPRDIAGIESVEVLKGPRSALFGRGEPGGTINLITKRPQFQTGGDVRVTVGRWNQLRLEGDVQSTLGSNDRFGFRLAGLYEDAESFRKTVETERLGLYPSFTWDVSGDTDITYELEFTRQEIPFDRGVVYADEFGFSPRKTFVGEPGDGPIETEVRGHQLELQHNFSNSWSLLAGMGYRETSLKGNASETNFGGRQTYFLDGRTISRFFRFRDFESDYFVLRAEIAGEFDTGSLRHRLLFGADHDQFDNRLFILRYRPGFFGAGTDINTLDPDAYLFLDAFNPVYGQSPRPMPGPNTDRDEEFIGTGIYVQDQIDVSDRLQIRLGLRWDDFEQDLTNLRAVPATTTNMSDNRVAGEARSRGFEFDANIQTDGGLNLWFSYANTNAEFTNSNPDADFGALIEEGDSLINSPEHQVNFQVSKSFRFGNMPAQIGGGVLYTDERAGWTGFDFTLPSYTTVRLFGRVELPAGVSLLVNVDNLFDEDYYTNSFADVWVEPGAPTRWRLTASYDF